MQAERRIERINQVLRCLRTVSRHIVRERDRKQLFDVVCSSLVGNGCYQGAWIALVDSDKKAWLMAHAGIETCVVALEDQLRQGQWPPLARRSLESGRVEVCGDGKAECAGCPCLDLCKGHATMVAPLRAGDKSFGLMCVQRINGKIYPEEKGLFLEITDDVSYALHSLHALGESEARFQSLVERLPAIVYTAVPGEDFRITYVSPQIETCLGYTPDEFSADPSLWLSRIYADDRDQVMSMANRPDAVGQPFRMEYRMISRDGRVCWFRDNAVLLDSGEEEMPLVQGVMVDITREKTALEDRRQMQARLLQIQKMDAIGTLVAGVSHDFNNMLTAIQGYAELAIMDLDEESAHYRYLKQIYGTSLKAADLVRRLLTFSRNRPVYMKMVDMNRLIREFVRMLERLLGENIQIKTDLAPDLLPVYADLTNMEQVFMNLSINAKDAMPDGGALTFSTRNVDLSDPGAFAPTGYRPGHYVLISVTDTGIGMSQDVMDHMFEPFFTTKEVGKGNGLGLSVTYGIIKDHHGWIECSSEPRKGSTFNIYMPVASEGAGDVERMVGLRSGSAGWRERNILVVEDEDAVRELVVEVLMAAGYRVSSAETLSGARDLCRDGQTWFDILFTDIVLPDGTGVELALELRGQNPDLKVVFSTGYTEMRALKALEDHSFYHLLKKPFSVTDLLDVVASAASGGQDG